MHPYFKYLCLTLVVLVVGSAFLAPTSVDEETADTGSPWSECLPVGYPITFDATIRESVAKHWPLEWQLYHCDWRAQLARESSLSTTSCLSANHAGAKCLAQILPGTAKDIEASTGLINTRSDTRAAIMGGAWYMAQLGNAWNEPRPIPCQMDLARAGYIAGSGHIYRAQRVARGKGEIARCFDDGIGDNLEFVIKKSNAEDVKNYISSIRELSIKMRQ